MWSPLSVSRWIFLLTLAVVMVFSASQVDSFAPVVDLPCCRNVSARKIPRIKACFEQKPREGCRHHAFLVTSKRGKQWCIDPTSKWLKDKIKRGELDCPPDLSLLNEVLGFDEV
ncbi:C-C motif chemokine 4-like [Amphiprion ocellaris]|uniref:Chemokine interleukin-8-like domain-containing protein n=2 Tax=Amphiprion TaxID=80969 RepID=A0A3Q1C019_AMPOC|nr:C-C motif chemokine 4-like [Amphiprion ocellaris]